MTVTGDRLPSERTILGVLDAGARRTMGLAKQRVAPIVSGAVPRDSGQTAAAMAPRIAKSSTGTTLTVGPTRGRRHRSGATIAQVVRWVTRGTGIHGPGGKPITSRVGGALALPGATRVKSVEGQRPNDFMGRIGALAAPAVERISEQGAQDASRDLERVIG